MDFRLGALALSFGMTLAAVGTVRATEAGSRPGLQPMPSPPELDARKVALGKRLFTDPRLSADEKVACSSCHNTAGGGVDNRKVSVGAHGKVGQINAPTVFNSGLNFAQFWNGRAKTLEEQIDGPLQDPVEMATTWPVVLGKLTREPSYSAAFQEIYGKAPDVAAVKDAIATFERALVTVDAPFDRYLRGDKKALSPAAAAGYDLFVKLDCTACHDGANLGGCSFERFGALGKPPFIKKGRAVTKADLGRYAVTKSEKDLYRFKVPGLRNVALTAPYFHDGSATTLAEAVRTMADVQLGLQLSDVQTANLTAFLESLSGKPPAILTAQAP